MQPWWKEEDDRALLVATWNLGLPAEGTKDMHKFFALVREFFTKRCPPAAAPAGGPVPPTPGPGRFSEQPSGQMTDLVSVIDGVGGTRKTRDALERGKPIWSIDVFAAALKASYKAYLDSGGAPVVR